MPEYNVGSSLKKILDVKESTLKTYIRNIKRLSKIADHENVPSNQGWLINKKGDALIKKIEKLPNNVARHLFLAGSLAVRMYSEEKKRSNLWSRKMNHSANKYSDQRLKQKKTDSEKKNWGKGWKDI